MKLSTVNTILLGLIILVNAYVILAPLLPALLFSVQSHQGKQQTLTQAIHPKKTATATPPADRSNHLVVPSMLLDQPLNEAPISQTYNVLNKGIWRWPGGSTPDKGSNTVLVGHRFSYTKPQGVFYYLNKVALGDEIGLFWNQKEYLYKVTSITAVPPTQTSVEAPTSDARLTIFTCTPLWLPKNRLVVVAKLETIYE